MLDWFSLFVGASLSALLCLAVYGLHRALMSSRVSPPPTTSSPPPPTLVKGQFTFTSIGTVSSVFKRKYGAPRQGSVIPSARGVIRMASHVPRESLEGLEGYSHLWVSFVFHANTNKKFHARVEPPRLGGRKVGVYGTRTPHRLNPLGISVVKLDKVVGKDIYISGLDIIEGTPVLDIKPYHPADCVPDFRAPAWHAETPPVPFEVTFSAETERQLEELVQQDKLQFYHTVPAIREAIRESASLDPRPVYLRKRQSNSEVYGYDLDRLNIRHTIDAETRTVHIVDVHLWEQTREYKDKDA
jgi:tRNA-Thr(GGU) m(6)t(6)A37 methyltransferase TsaA